MTKMENEMTSNICLQPFPLVIAFIMFDLTISPFIEHNCIMKNKFLLISNCIFFF